MNPIFIEAAIGILRHLVGAGGAYIAATGIVDAETSTVLVGAVMTILATLASVVAKYRKA